MASGQSGESHEKGAACCTSPKYRTREYSEPPVKDLVTEQGLYTVPPGLIGCHVTVHAYDERLELL